jgi:hypothetical protein
MVRVAGLERRVAEGDTRPGPDGLSPRETLLEISKRAHELSDQQHRCFMQDLLPELQAAGVRLLWSCTCRARWCRASCHCRALRASATSSCSRTWCTSTCPCCITATTCSRVMPSVSRGTRRLKRTRTPRPACSSVSSLPFRRRSAPSSSCSSPTPKRSARFARTGARCAASGAPKSRESVPWSGSTPWRAATDGDGGRRCCAGGAIPERRRALRSRGATGLNGKSLGAWGELPLQRQALEIVGSGVPAQVSR